MERRILVSGKKRPDYSKKIYILRKNSVDIYKIILYIIFVINKGEIK